MSHVNDEVSTFAAKTLHEDKGVEWVPSTSSTASHLAGRAVVGGNEAGGGSPLWVIRTSHQGDLLPGKLRLKHNDAYVCYNGKEIKVTNLEVLCAEPGNVSWVPASDGIIPPNAIPGGHTASREPLYVGRARHEMSLTPGKVHPSHQLCYIPYGGKEINYKQYDILCWD